MTYRARAEERSGARRPAARRAQSRRSFTSSNGCVFINGVELLPEFTVGSVCIEDAPSNVDRANRVMKDVTVLVTLAVDRRVWDVHRLVGEPPPTNGAG